jgi:hypothetical protein
MRKVAISVMSARLSAWMKKSVLAEGISWDFMLVIFTELYREKSGVTEVEKICRFST